MTTIEQKKFANRHKFTFNRDTVNYSFQDGSDSGDINVPYSAIPKETVTKVERPQWLFNLGCVALAVGIFEVFRALLAGYPLTGTGTWVLFGLICIGLTRVFSVTYTVLQTQHGNLFVIRDGKTHDRLIEELSAHRKDHLRKLYDRVNVHRSVDDDLANFQWLRDEGVLTTDEFEKRVTSARLAVREKVSHDGENRYA